MAGYMVDSQNSRLDRLKVQRRVSESVTIEMCSRLLAESAHGVLPEVALGWAMSALRVGADRIASIDEEIRQVEVGPHTLVRGS